MPGKHTGKRDRGVETSPEALNQALLGAGLKSQTALAARIADLEELDSPPRHSVNRAFRGHAVSPLTVARIARALDVPPHSLYRSSDSPSDPPDTGLSAATNAVDDSDRSPAAATPSATSPAALPRNWAIVAAVLALLMLGVWMQPLVGRDPAVPGGDAKPVVLQPVLGPFSIALHALPGEHAAALAQSIRQSLHPEARVSSNSGASLVSERSPQQVIEALRTDLVISARREQYGRVITYRFEWSSRTDTGTLAVESFLHATEAAHLSAVGQRVAQAINHLMGKASGPALHVADLQAHRDYLDGRLLLDDRGQVPNIERAISRFESAVESDPGYALAHAGLCDARLHGSWMNNSEEAMSLAGESCARAMTLAQWHPYVHIAHAHWLRLSGDVPGAITHLQRVLDEHPNHPEALATLAESQFDSYRQSTERSVLLEAIDAATEASRLEPDYWRWPSLAGTYHYFAQNLPAAIDAQRRALDLNENDLVLANLGIMLFCSGLLEETQVTYEHLKRISPDSYLASEYLGLVHYYLGNFDLAVKLRTEAVERIGADGSPEVHDMWGNLADTQRHAGDLSDALASYRRAAEIVERDFLEGIAGHDDHAHRAHYHVMIRRLSGESIQGSIREAIVSDLEALPLDQLDNAGLVRVAQGWKFLDEPDRSDQAANVVRGKCLGLARHPDLNQNSIAIPPAPAGPSS